MSFKFPKNAEPFFRALHDAAKGAGVKVDTQFEPYYFCLMVGLDRGNLGPDEEVGEEFVKDYVQAFQPYADLIAGLLVDAELKRNKIQPDDGMSIEKKIVQLLDPSSATKLSSHGMDLLNRYAAGGFLVLHEYFAAPPQNLEQFLVTYARSFGETESRGEQ